MAAKNTQRILHNTTGGRSSSGKQIQLSKSLSWLLRHAVVKEGLQFQPNGYVLVEDVLKHPKFVHKYTIDDIRQCVETDEKTRFGLKTDEITGKEMIRAHQGHSLEAANVEMREIVDPKEFPNVIHGTYMKHWPMIKSQGLSKMNRTHIHFAPGLPKEFGVISGMRSNVQIHIYVDMEKAIADGIKFFVSSNNVILSPGDENGYLPARYFLSVQNQNGEQLLSPIDSFNTTTSNN